MERGAGKPVFCGGRKQCGLFGISSCSLTHDRAAFFKTPAADAATATLFLQQDDSFDLPDVEFCRNHFAAAAGGR
jgi:hypothetical protein